MASFTLLIIGKNSGERLKAVDKSMSISLVVFFGISGAVITILAWPTANASVGKNLGYFRWLGWVVGGTSPGINDEVTG